MKEILIKVTTSDEEYDNVHSEIILDDFIESAEDRYWKIELVNKND